MASSTRIVSIVIALLVATGMIGSAYIFSGPTPFFGPKKANAASTEELLKAYSAKDSDNDGLPDWQEALYGSDPNNPHSINANLTDGEAVAQGLVQPKFKSATPGAASVDTPSTIPGTDPAPDSLTEQLAHEFFQSYMDASGGQPMTADDQQTLINQLLQDFTTKARALVISPYTNVSVHTSTSVTMDEYAANVEQIFSNNDVDTASADPVSLMNAFLVNNDATIIPKLKTLSDKYDAIAKQLAALQVPPALAADHLALMAAFDTRARATKVVTNFAQDPVAVLGALSIYQPTSDSVFAAFQDMASSIVASDGPATDESSNFIVNTARFAQGS